MSKGKVLLGMSGGVDSSVAAHLLLQDGYEVIGATMRLWVDEEDPEAGGCCSLSAVEDARHVAQKLSIPHYVLNYKDAFRREVVDYFVAEYQAGRTPNPCIACNARVRFNMFLPQARSLGCDYVATGHYARVWRGPKGEYRLLKGVDARKDQSYMLYRMTEEHLSQTLFPLGEFTKEQVRSIANDLGMVVADKPDSQEICFIPDDDYRAFLLKQGAVKTKTGPIVDRDGNVLGTHSGAFNYTVGQRRGLGVSAPAPLYVLQVDVKHNKVIVGYQDELMVTEVYVEDLHFTYMPQPKEHLAAKVRYSMHEAPCTLSITGDNRATVKFDTPIRAATPGQSLVLYSSDTVVGGGIII